MYTHTHRVKNEFTAMIEEIVSTLPYKVIVTGYADGMVCLSYELLCPWYIRLIRAIPLKLHLFTRCSFIVKHFTYVYITLDDGKIIFNRYWGPYYHDHNGFYDNILEGSVLSVDLTNPDFIERFKETVSIALRGYT